MTEDMLEMADITMPLSFCFLSCKGIDRTTRNPDPSVLWPYGATCVCI